jgi:single-strand DNA-binding protein
MSYHAKGRIYHIGEPIVINDKLRRKDFVLEVLTGDKTEFIQFETMYSTFDMLKEWHRNQFVEVDFELRGRIWKDRFITTIKATKITPIV